MGHMTQETLSLILGKDIERATHDRYSRCTLLVAHIETIDGMVCGLAEYSCFDRNNFAVRANFHPCNQYRSEDNMLAFFEHIENLMVENRYRRFSYVVGLAFEDCLIWSY